MQLERGREGLRQHRRNIVEQLWREWSPNRRFDQDAFAASATSFDNPDFVDVVIHSYRIRFVATPSDLRFDVTEQTVAGQPPITVPTNAIDPTRTPSCPRRSRRA